MAVRLSIQNFRGLRHVEAEFGDGVSVIVGPNGVGKSTLLEVPAIFGTAFVRSWREALTRHGGLFDYRHVAANEDDPVELSLTFSDTTWDVVMDGTVAGLDKVRESLKRDGRVLESADARAIPPSTADDLAAFFAKAALFHRFGDASGFLRERILYFGEFEGASMLRARGSEYAADSVLSSDGANALTVLRNWKDKRATRGKYDFVIASLREAFPNFDDLEFEATSNVVDARVFARGARKSTPLRNAANGFLHAMLCLMGVASVADGGLATIDEPETALHPFAIRRVLAAITEWSEEHNVDVLLATHSPVLIDALHDHPERLYVFSSPDQGGFSRLTDLHDGAYLARFSVGDLYAEARLGAPRVDRRPDAE